MRRLPLYRVDAFADAVFRGNPAAVCPLPAWEPDALLQAIAAENNLSETAFLVWPADPVPLRWFTPRQEVPLCGHATLASGLVVLACLAPERDSVTFATRSGALVVRREAGAFAMDLPALTVEPVGRVPAALLIVRGAEKIVRLVLGLERKARGRVRHSVAWINGEPTLVSFADARLLFTTSVATDGERLTAFYRVLSPDKLGRIERELGP